MEIGPRDLSRRSALSRLHERREAFEREAADRFHGGGEAASRDGDRLERLADRLVDWIRAADGDLEGLEVARETAAWRGPVLVRRRPRLDPPALAEALATPLAKPPCPTRPGPCSRRPSATPLASRLLLLRQEGDDVRPVRRAQRGA